jgi:hypothetical protein
VGCSIIGSLSMILGCGGRVCLDGFGICGKLAISLSI